MNNGEDRRKAAKRELDEIRAGVRKAPDPPAENAPDWLHGVEEMRDFFDSAARVWDDVFGPEGNDTLYRAVAEQIPETADAVHILVLGCGTGLELNNIFECVPNARITGIDLAPGMLAELRKKFRDRSGQIELIEGSYVDVPLGENRFDYAVATLTVHHLPPEAKLGLFRNVLTALKPGGSYIEGDQSHSAEHEAMVLRWYNEYIATLPGGDRGQWNYDITLCAETEQRLLREAGFSQVEMTWEKRHDSGEGRAVFVAVR